MAIFNEIHLDDGPVFWKEERVQGAVYNVYLKRVKYHTLPETIDNEDALQGISHLASETLKIKSIKSGSLDRLIESLVLPTGEMDSSYVNVFLSTYRSYASTQAVLDAIINRFKELHRDKDMKFSLKQDHFKSLRSILSMWLDAYTDDFRQPPAFPCLRQLAEFAENNMEDNGIVSRVQKKIERFQREFDLEYKVDPLLFHFCLCDEVDLMLQTEFTRPLEFNQIPNVTIAEQLTWKDAELLKKLVPHHCLGSIWSNRDRKPHDAPTIVATVSQFNAVLHRVVATILNTPKRKRSQRAKVITKWICVANELREMKNFSSLKAIISGLQSNAVYRLQKTWASIPKEYIEVYQELSEIFSEENNQITQRELLMKEGTAKFAESGISWRNGKTKKSWKRRSLFAENGSVSGTIPYLGTFLTDLTMIDAAIPDLTDDGLVNFEKKRKEFEILAQLKLVQSSANLYFFKEDLEFTKWFSNVRVYDENESYEQSCELEPPVSPKKKKVPTATLR